MFSKFDDFITKSEKLKYPSPGSPAPANNISPASKKAKVSAYPASFHIKTKFSEQLYEQPGHCGGHYGGVVPISLKKIFSGNSLQHCFKMRGQIVHYNLTKRNVDAYLIWNMRLENFKSVYDYGDVCCAEAIKKQIFAAGRSSHCYRSPVT